MSTGDIITPREIENHCPTLFGKVDSFDVVPVRDVYQKFEAGSEAWCRYYACSRSAYDLAMLVARLYEQTIDWETLREAVQRTSEHRGSSDMMKDYELVSRERLKA